MQVGKVIGGVAFSDAGMMDPRRATQIDFLDLFNQSDNIAAIMQGS